MSPTDLWGLAELVKVVAGANPGYHDLLVRIADSIGHLESGGRGPAIDMAVLIRQALRVLERTSGAQEELVVPGPEAGWPTLQQWRHAGLFAMLLADGTTRLRAEPWRPGWLPGGDRQSIEDALYDAPAPIRKRPPTPGDHCVGDALGFGGDPHTYTSPAHKQAVRAALAAPAGSTVAVLLPTGAGKSTVAFAPALLAAPGSLSVVVVPTVSLALDLEDKFQKVLRAREEPTTLGNRYAYVSEISDDSKVAIRQAMRAGEQRIVFTSPESLMGGLAAALYDTASAGRLRRFVIDEAHLVAEWGAEFRPEYQAMAALRTDLRRAASESGKPPFRTLLMSATLNQESLGALVDLYGEPGPFQVVSGMSLRAEPAYWLRECANDTERETFLLDALAHLPRPAIVYATRPQDAEAWATKIRSAGYQRVATVTGGSKTNQRAAVMNKFRDGEVDVVVATSAFGLGVDNHHVRSVVHVCVPETIDRWYQEVGRGGRDGEASVALLLWTTADLGIATNLNKKRFIGEEKGSERYGLLMDGADSLGNSRFRFDLGQWAARLGGGSDENVRWNIRTLTLLTRAGIVVIETERPPTRPAGMSIEAWQERAEAEFEAHHNSLVVRIEHPLDDTGHEWRSKVEPRRQEAKQASQEGLQRMMAALEPGAALCELLLGAYTIPANPAVGGLEEGIRPVLACNGCPAHRDQGHRPAVLVHARPPAVTGAGLHASVASLFRGKDILLVSYERVGDWRRRVDDLVQTLVERGVRLVIGPEEVVNRRALARLHRSLPDRYLFTEEMRVGDEDEPDVDDLPAVPAVFVLPGRERPVIPADWVRVGIGARPRLLVVPSDARDHQRLDRAAIDVSPISRTTVPILLERL